MTESQQAWKQGFIAKCAEVGVDPEKLLKQAGLWDRLKALFGGGGAAGAAGGGAAKAVPKPKAPPAPKQKAPADPENIYAKGRQPSMSERLKALQELSE